MNANNRKELETAVKHIEDAQAILEGLAEGEQDKHDNLSEGLQASMKGEQLAENADNLSEAVSSVNDAKDNLEQALSSIENVS